MIAFKFLRPDALAIFSGRSWQPPQPGEAGPWVEAGDGPLLPCVNGIHASAPHDLAFWLAEELWQVELEGETIDGPQAIVSRRGRLLHRVEGWNAEAALALARACLQRAAAAVAAAGESAPGAARSYVREAQGFIDRGDGVVAAYASALAVSALAPVAEADAAFRAERREQSLLLAQQLKLSV